MEFLRIRDAFFEDTPICIDVKWSDGHGLQGDISVSQCPRSQTTHTVIRGKLPPPRAGGRKIQGMLFGWRELQIVCDGRRCNQTTSLLVLTCGYKELLNRVF